MKNYLFEVCTNSVESCIAAQEGGANRVELCAGIPEGGTTPSYGEIAMAREVLTTTRLHVIIRPRGGDFLYSPVEVKTMLKDIDGSSTWSRRGGVWLPDYKWRDRRTGDETIDGGLERLICHFPSGI